MPFDGGLSPETELTRLWREYSRAYARFLADRSGSVAADFLAARDRFWRAMEAQ